MNNAMDLAPRLQEHVVFHLTGKRVGAGTEPVEGLHLRPALFARFGDLTHLRYDFPVVLVEPGTDGEYLRSLSALLDAALKRIAPAGIAGERLRKNVLRQERQIRALLCEGKAGTLLELWDASAAQLAGLGGEAMHEDLARARSALEADGRLVDCDGELPALLATHAWRTVQHAKSRKMRREIDALIVRLADLVKADYLRSEAGRHAETLEAGIGGAHRALFDFQAMARLLAKPSGGSALSATRRRRIESALAALRAERFFAAEGAHVFLFEETRDAIAAYRKRLPEMAELVKAMTIADLEVQGRYVEAKHDALFDGWGPDSLGQADLARFPDYLVCRTAQRARKGGAAARALLLKVLSGGAPIRIVVESGTLLEDSLAGEGGFSLGAQLATTAMGLNDVYVLQSAASNLYRARGQLLGAMQYPGAALINVYSGAGTQAPAAGDPPPYLLAAAAQESRVFPAFCYDPGAGADWAARFSLEHNPQPDEDWPRHEFAWADDKLQRTTERLQFTLADFAACDPRYARHFARVPREAWNEKMVAVADWLARPANGVPETVPCVPAVDAENRLHRLIVDEKLLHAARVCREAWRRLQELDGLKRARAAAALAAAAPATAAAATAAPAAAPAATQGPAPAEAAPAAAGPAAQERKAGEPYIETERCSSCNECTNLNGAMFAYNENKQAYIANPDAGTFRDLVEAAESCQVAVIHPGKPRN
ncbi:MAG TPA: ferredoxin, partial [Burkholderiales bacterium]